jgi:class 3 adenylate cyclase
MNVLYCAIHVAASEVAARRLEADFDAFNALVRRWEPAIHRHAGFISHTIGHAVYALFPGPPEAALEAALELLEIVEDFDRDGEPSIPRRPPVEVGIAVTRGPLLVGPVGDGDHLTTGVAGEAIEAAPRIAAACRGRRRRLLISGPTRDAMREPTRWALRAIDPSTSGAEDLPGPVFEVLDRAEMERADSAS